MKWKMRATDLSSTWGCPKWWYPTTICFPSKNDHFGVFWGYQHVRKHSHDQFKILKFFVSFSSSPPTMRHFGRDSSVLESPAICRIFWERHPRSYGKTDLKLHVEVWCVEYRVALTVILGMIFISTQLLSLRRKPIQKPMIPGSS